MEGRRQRGEFTTLSAEHVEWFQSEIGKENVVLDGDEVSPFVIDITRKFSGIGSIVLTPTTTEQVSSLLKYFND